MFRYLTHAMCGCLSFKHSLFSSLLPALLLTYGHLVHITQSHTMESMSFTYQRSSTSLSIATKPSSSHMLLDSDSEEDSLPYLPISSEPNGAGDILEISLWSFPSYFILSF